jgi:hypothetical protein
MTTSFLRKMFWRTLIAVLLLLAAGCTAPATTDGADVEHDDQHEADSHEHSDDVVRIPNDGAVITIAAPAMGTTFSSGDDIVVEITIENFILNEDGSHWHVYVDGESHGMVVGNNTRQVLHGLAPGDHEIIAYLAVGTHEELEEGGITHISITE